ncbi:hypothetical protein HHI36_012006 [Cryptolaemus montrouzieri]|uniref:Peptidase S1 domain-containing protein n=1 Tax=Cryptolaemus montrouzieri TaxID=559131 RepID=A0ABD2NE00_9CUCU
MSEFKSSFFIFVVLTFIAGNQSGCTNNQELGIIGGKVVDIKDYPYQVSVQYFDEHYCGGSIINDRFIVTAAHCTNKKTIYSINVRVGTSFHDKKGKVFYLKAIHQHPQFNELYDFDISLLELEQTLVFGSTIQPIPLWNQNETIPIGSMATVTGWGTTESHGTAFSPQLRKVDIPILSDEKCKSAYGDEITVNMFCAGFLEGGGDACHGDSGGPLVVNKVLLGIVSWGDGCGIANYPGVYSSIPALRPFIDKILSFP